MIFWDTCDDGSYARLHGLAWRVPPPYVFRRQKVFGDADKILDCLDVVHVLTFDAGIFATKSHCARSPGAWAFLGIRSGAIWALTLPHPPIRIRPPLAAANKSVSSVRANWKTPVAFGRRFGTGARFVAVVLPRANPEAGAPALRIQQDASTRAWRPTVPRWASTPCIPMSRDR